MSGFLCFVVLVITVATIIVVAQRTQANITNPNRVVQILLPGEKVEFIAKQQKPILNATPHSFVFTNKRFILYRPELFGGAEFSTHIWRDLEHAQLREDTIGATLTIETIRGYRLVLDYLPRAQARQIYAMTQIMEEQMREERRTREHEDRRAGASVVSVQTMFPGISVDSTQPRLPIQSVPALQENSIQALKKLKDMLDDNLITQIEYDTKKAEILSRI